VLKTEDIFAINFKKSLEREYKRESLCPLRKRLGDLICKHINVGRNKDPSLLQCYTPSTGTRKFPEGLGLHQ
jgi:hypothetical protein